MADNLWGTARRRTAGQIKAVVLLFCMLASALSANAEQWKDARYQLSGRAPIGWYKMDNALLAHANASVNHITGRGFIAGYSLHQGNTLLFPYMLVQYKPYTGLPEQVRATHQIDERGKLELINNLVAEFRRLGPLPDTIDTPQFIDRYGNEHAQLTRLEPDGRFDFMGKIPHEQGQTPIRYHTHAVMGKDGIAMVTIFNNESLNDLSQVISEEMRAMRFSDGFDFAALPKTPPVPTTSPETNSAQANANTAAQPNAEATTPETTQVPSQTPGQALTTNKPESTTGRAAEAAGPASPTDPRRQ